MYPHFWKAPSGLFAWSRSCPPAPICWVTLAKSTHRLWNIGLTHELMLLMFQNAVVNQFNFDKIPWTVKWKFVKARSVSETWTCLLLTANPRRPNFPIQKPFVAQKNKHQWTTKRYSYDIWPFSIQKKQNHLSGRFLYCLIATQKARKVNSWRIVMNYFSIFLES